MNDPAPILLTPNAIYGIMAMVGLICIILGFWCGKHCNAKSLNKRCCKLCVFWCDDNLYAHVYDDEIEPEWNHWNNGGGSVRSSKSEDAKHINMKLMKQKKRKKSAENERMSINQNNGNIHSYQSTSDHNHQHIGRNLRMRFPMTPLTSLSHKLPKQQSIEQSPDVRVAHFLTPNVADDNVASFAFDEFDGNMDKMESIESDQEDGPMTNDPLTNAEDAQFKQKVNQREDSFDGFALEQNGKRQSVKDLNVQRSPMMNGGLRQYASDDMINSSGDEDNAYPIKWSLSSSKNTKRVMSVDSLLSEKAVNKRRNKQIIVLNSSKAKRVISPPPIHSKSEFQSLISPSISADAIALKKQNQR